MSKSEGGERGRSELRWDLRSPDDNPWCTKNHASFIQHSSPPTLELTNRDWNPPQTSSRPSWPSPKQSKLPLAWAMRPPKVRNPITLSAFPANQFPAATREAMSEAKLPLAYRDSCAGLLIPLNRCRYEEYYLPWKCEVRMEQHTTGRAGLAFSGKQLTCWGYRQKDTATRSANMTNSRSGLRRWTSWGRQRVVREAIEVELYL